MAHAAENPMAIKRANESTFEAQIDQARKGLTPRRARKVGGRGAGCVDVLFVCGVCRGGRIGIGMCEWDGGFAL
jgi:hypothetical protein